MNKETKNIKIKKSLSRLIAIQILYQHYFNNKSEDINLLIDRVIDNYSLNPDDESLQSYREKVDMCFLTNLLNGIILVMDKIDNKISINLDKNHKIENIQDTLLEILRLATFELKFIKLNPKNVVINEYTDIADSFFDKKKVNFVNGILNKISQDIN